MFTAFRSWITARRFGRRPATRPSVRPALEGLEARVVPTVTYHGGPLLRNVEVQGLYLGSDWNSTTALRQQASQTDGFLNNLVHGSYMDMLTNAGYGVGRGSFTAGRVDARALNKSVFLTDGQIQNVVQQDVTRGLARPDANRLYVVYVEPGVAVSMGGGNSIRNFLGYHSDFVGNDGAGHRLNIYYAVIPYQGGINAHDTRVTSFESSTEVTSHELAEAVTDPVPGRGWYDNRFNEEIGDFTHDIVRLNGYVVQKEVNKNDQIISPVGATSVSTRFASPQSSASSGALSAFVSTSATASAGHGGAGVFAPAFTTATHVGDELFRGIF